MKPGRNTGQVAQQNKRIVKQIPRGVAASFPAGPGGDVDAQNMIRRLQKIVPGRFQALCIAAHGIRIATKIAKRHQRAKLHDLN